jgi:Fe2+ transport system protein B
MLVADRCGELRVGLKRKAGPLELERRSIFLFLIFGYFLSRKSNKKEELEVVPELSKRLPSIKSSYINFMSWVEGYFFQTQKAEMTF